MRPEADSLDRLYHEEVRKCTRCQEHQEIQRQSREESTIKKFMLHWLPYRRGGPPFAFVLLGMEPSFSGVREGVEYPREGGFHGGLRFAISKYLLQDPQRESFLITNMGKCTIAGNLCRQTRCFRWKKCGPFLEREVRLAEPSLGSTVFIGIGRDPIRFIRGHHSLYGGFFQGRPIYYLTHYSPRNQWIFQRFARENVHGFQEFSAQTSTEFGQFLTEESADEDLESFQSNPERDLSRLFKWSHEMSEIRKLRVADR